MNRYTGNCRCRLIRFECELDMYSQMCGSRCITRSFRMVAGDHALGMEEADEGGMQLFYCSHCASSLVWREKTHDGMLYVVPLQALAEPAPSNFQPQEVNPW